jgi:mannose-6-phosphate isomerase-like protein (cupin superfamily)
MTYSITSSALNKNVSEIVAPIALEVLELTTAAVPLHMHQVEETVVMFEGRIWVQLGEERRVIGPNDTVIIPPLTPHAWGTEGTEEARMMWVYGGPDPFTDSTYFEGQPPKQHA